MPYLNAQSTEVSVHEVLMHLRTHSMFTTMELPALKMLKAIVEVECCEKSSLIICITCGEVLLIRLATPGVVCDCLTEMFN